jgi:hypothetical protein
LHHTVAGSNLLDDLVTLCSRCQGREHARKLRVGEASFLDEDRATPRSAAEASASRSQRRNAAGDGLDLPVARFFPALLAHLKGPAAGQPFTLEPWQRRFVEEFSRVNGEGERIYKRGLLGVANLVLASPVEHR